MYEVTGERRYRQIAEYFLEEVVTARNYVIGNTSVGEHWTTPPGQLQSTLGWENAECCVAYNLMKLQRLVFGWTGAARWMDEYERALFNSRLGTQNSQGLKQYFMPLAAGYWRAYNSPEESFWCCTGTGAEEFAKFTDTIYYQRGADVYISQFIASTLDWRDQGFKLEQTTRFPREPGTTVKVKASHSNPRTLHLRIPGWTAGTAEVRVNGRLLEAVADPGSYVGIRRTWRDGDTISVHLPMQSRHQALPGDNSITAVLHGPVVLAANLGAGPAPDSPERVVHGRDTAPQKLPAPGPLPRETGSGYEMLPLYLIGEQRYSVYWQT
jgi:hypothetical protein